MSDVSSDLPFTTVCRLSTVHCHLLGVGWKIFSALRLEYVRLDRNRKLKTLPYVSAREGTDSP